MPTPARLRVLALACCLIVCCATGEAGVVRLNRQAEVSGGLIRLGDVAEIHTDSAQATERLADVTIAPAPVPGRNIVIGFDLIRSRLVAQGVGLAEIEFTGSSSVLVATVAEDDGSHPRNAMLADSLQRQIAERLEKALAAFVQQQSPELGLVGVTAELTFEQVAQLATAASARYEISGSRQPGTGSQEFGVKYYDRQGKLRQFVVRGVVAPLPQVVVAAHNLPKGHILRAEDLSRRQLDPSEKGIVLTDAGLVIGRETTRTLRVGDAFRENDIRGIPLVRRGDIVTVFAGSGGIRVRMEAKSQGDGCAGERIKLTSLDGRRELTATVTGYHEAAAGPPGSDDIPALGGVGVRLLEGRN
jgi:flagellar basal body P-ring formation protein FlgA